MFKHLKTKITFNSIPYFKNTTVDTGGVIIVEST